MAHFDDNVERLIQDHMPDKERIEFIQSLIYTCNLQFMPVEVIAEADELMFAGLVKPAA